MDDYDKILGTINGVKQLREQVGNSYILGNRYESNPRRLGEYMTTTPTETKMIDFYDSLDMPYVSLEAGNSETGSAYNSDNQFDSNLVVEKDGKQFTPFNQTTGSVVLDSENKNRRADRTISNFMLDRMNSKEIEMMNKGWKGRKAVSDETFGEEGFVLGHELGHHYQKNSSMQERREILNKLNAELEGSQYDVRAIERLTRPMDEKSKQGTFTVRQHQREADVFGQAFMHIVNGTEPQDRFVNSYMEMIKRNSIMKD